LDATPPLKIALLVEPTPFNYISGYANRFKEMLTYLKKAGDEVHILTPDDSENPPTEFLGFPIRSVKGFRFPLYKQVSLSIDSRGETGKILAELKPDLIHVTTPGMLVLPAIYYAYKHNIPLVISFHTNIITYAKTYVRVPGAQAFGKWLLRTAHGCADLTLVTSPQLKEECSEYGIRRLGVWQKGINTERFSPDFCDVDMRARLAGGNEHVGAPLGVYVGRLGGEKRLDRLKSVLDENPGLRLALVGDGPARADLEKHFEGMPVHFTGPLSGDELSQSFASADMFLMPSDSETLGFVVLEAMASGIPVVAVDAGGVPDNVCDGKNGFLCDNSDEGRMVEFSHRVAQLMADKDLRKEMGIEGRRWAESWSWESATSVLRNIQYRGAIAMHRLARRDEGRRYHFDELEKVIGSAYTLNLK
jgi:sulfoquinovosyltransferase